MTPRLSLATLGAAAPAVARPPCDPRALPLSVLHFGPGAFHRAHQAAYFDALNATDPRWGISAVSLHSRAVRDALEPQDGLYTLALQGAQAALRIVGALREVIVAPDDPARVFARLLSPALEIVTTTVTEKGYCLRADGTLDLHHADVARDLTHPAQPASLVGWLVEALHRRAAAGLAPFLLLPCDNLPANGPRLKAALKAYAAQARPALVPWLDEHLACPATMVDAITPATDDALRASVAAATGLHDAWPVQREHYAQWVVANHAHRGAPAWARVGVTLTDDLPAFERAKLWLLNGAHSCLAYAGLLRGHATVAQAIADPLLAVPLRRYLEGDLLPLLRDAGSPLDLPAYIDTVLARFANPAVRHALAQVAADGSQKLPVRVLAPLRQALERGADVAGYAWPLVAWLRFVHRQALAGRRLDDPLADELHALALTLRGGPGDVDAALALRAVFPEDIARDARVRAALRSAYAGLLPRV